MVLRWVAAGVLDAAKGCRREKGCKDMPTLVVALRTRDAQSGSWRIVGDDRVVVNRAAAEFQQRAGQPLRSSARIPLTKASLVPVNRTSLPVRLLC